MRILMVLLWFAVAAWWIGRLPLPPNPLPAPPEVTPVDAPAAPAPGPTQGQEPAAESLRVADTTVPVNPTPPPEAAAPPPALPAVEPVANPSEGVWDRLADCESSGRWDIRDSYHQGGLQFAASTWDAYRPDGYPDDAYDASREQQIDVGRLVLAAQGPGAWPTCGPRVGLRRGM